MSRMRRLYEKNPKFARALYALGLALAGVAVCLAATLIFWRPTYDCVSYIFFYSDVDSFYEESAYSDSVELARNYSESYIVYFNEDFILRTAAPALERQYGDRLSKSYDYRELGRHNKAVLYGNMIITTVVTSTKNPEDSNIINAFFADYASRQITELCGAGKYQVFPGRQAEAGKPNLSAPLLTAFSVAAALWILGYLCCPAIIAKRRKIRFKQDFEAADGSVPVIAAVPLIKPNHTNAKR